MAYRSNHVDFKKRAIVELQEVEKDVNHLHGLTYHKDEDDDCEEGGGLSSIAFALRLVHLVGWVQLETVARHVALFVVAVADVLIGAVSASVVGGSLDLSRSFSLEALAAPVL